MKKGLRPTILRGAFVALVAAAIPCAPLATAPAEAAFSGINGKIAFNAFLDGESRIFVMNPDGSDVTQITDPPPGMNIGDFFPAWSPDGTKIAFEGEGVSGPPDIFVINADGSGRTNVTSSPGSDERACWSPDGTKILFRSSRDLSSGELYVMNTDGSNQVRLTNNTSYEGDPAWSPDGTKIVYTSPQPGGGDIYVMNADGSNPINLTGDNANNQTPDWSPDGTKLVFASQRDGARRIWQINADGSNRTPLTEPGGFYIDPSWSPDGTRIVYALSGTGVMWIMNADGSGQTALNLFGAAAGPNWQPLTPMAPAITCPSEISVSAEDGECTAVGTFDVTATGFPFPTVTCTPESGSVFALGTTEVSCTASNDVGADAVCSFFVTVTEDDAPSVSDISVSPSVIWPPDRRMVDVEVSYTAEDCSGEVACSLSVTSNEPIDGPGDRSPDWEVVDAHHVRLRAERARHGTGRVYTITITCTDGAGNTSTSDVTVTVPRSQ